MLVVEQNGKSKILMEAYNFFFMLIPSYLWDPNQKKYANTHLSETAAKDILKTS